MYTDVVNAVYTYISGVFWSAQSIKTIPDNVSLDNPGAEYIRVTILPNGKGVNMISKSGLIMIDIFTEPGKGQSRSLQIANMLDQLFQNKYTEVSTGKSIQFGSSSVRTSVGSDSHYRSIYSLPFSFNGVI